MILIEMIFSSEWAERYGTVNTWPEDLVSDSRYIGVEGSDGVFTLATLTRYSISYVSFSFIQNSLSNLFHIRLVNKVMIFYYLHVFCCYFNFS